VAPATVQRQPFDGVAHMQIVGVDIELIVGREPRCKSGAVAGRPHHAQIDQAAEP
jgi:hypothetical protein